MGRGPEHVGERELNEGAPLDVPSTRVVGGPKTLLDLIQVQQRAGVEEIGDDVRGRPHVPRVAQRHRSLQVIEGYATAPGDRFDGAEHLKSDALSLHVPDVARDRQFLLAAPACFVERRRTQQCLELGAEAPQVADSAVGRLRHVCGPVEVRDRRLDVAPVAMDGGHAPHDVERQLRVGRGGEDGRRQLLGALEPPAPRQRLDELRLHVAAALPGGGRERKRRFEEVDRCARRNGRDLAGRTDQPADGLEIPGRRAARVLPGDLLHRCPGASKRLAGGAVQVAALGRQHVVVHSLSDEVVAEAEPLTVTDDQPGERGVAQPRRDLDDRLAGQRGQLRQREARPQQARQSQQVTCALGEPGQATDEGCAEAGGDGRFGDLGHPCLDAQVLLLVERAQELGHEQRVAARRLQTVAEPLTGGRSHQGRGERLHVELVERTQKQVAAADLHDRLDHTIEQHGPRHGPEGAEDGQGRRGRALDGGSQHAERQVVGPVEVLGDEHDGRRARQRLEGVGAPLDHGVAQILDVAIVGGAVEEIAQLRSVRCGEALVGGERVGDVTGTAGDLVGRHTNDGHPRGPRRVRQRGQQVALADPGFTLDQHGAARTGRQCCEHLVHHGELEAAADRGEPVGRGGAVHGRPQLPRLGEALEPHAPSVHEAHDGCRPSEQPDDVGHQHVAAVGAICDAGGGVDRAPDRVVVEIDDLASVDADPHPRRRVAEGALAGHAERHGLAR